MNQDNPNVLDHKWVDPHCHLDRCQSPELEPKQRLRITLYSPDGTPEVYEHCVILGSLMPELEFKGMRLDPYLGRIVATPVHVTATTLPYKIEALTDVIH